MSPIVLNPHLIDQLLTLRDLAKAGSGASGTAYNNALQQLKETLKLVPKSPQSTVAAAGTQLEPHIIDQLYKGKLPGLDYLTDKYMPPIHVGKGVFVAGKPDVVEMRYDPGLGRYVPSRVVDIKTTYRQNGPGSPSQADFPGTMNTRLQNYIRSTQSAYSTALGVPMQYRMMGFDNPYSIISGKVAPHEAIAGAHRLDSSEIEMPYSELARRAHQAVAFASTLSPDISAALRNRYNSGKNGTILQRQVLDPARSWATDFGYLSPSLKPIYENPGSKYSKLRDALNAAEIDAIAKQQGFENGAKGYFGGPPLDTNQLPGGPEDAIAERARRALNAPGMTDVDKQQAAEAQGFHAIEDMEEVAAKIKMKGSDTYRKNSWSPSENSWDRRIRTAEFSWARKYGELGDNPYSLTTWDWGRHGREEFLERAWSANAIEKSRRNMESFERRRDRIAFSYRKKGDRATANRISQAFSPENLDELVVQFADSDRRAKEIEAAQKLVKKKQDAIDAERLGFEGMRDSKAFSYRMQGDLGSAALIESTRNLDDFRETLIGIADAAREANVETEKITEGDRKREKWGNAFRTMPIYDWARWNSAREEALGNIQSGFSWAPGSSIFNRLTTANQQLYSADVARLQGTLKPLGMTANMLSTGLFASGIGATPLGFGLAAALGGAGLISQGIGNWGEAKIRAEGLETASIGNRIGGAFELGKLGLDVFMKWNSLVMKVALAPLELFGKALRAAVPVVGGLVKAIMGSLGGGHLGAPMLSMTGGVYGDYQASLFGDAWSGSGQGSLWRLYEAQAMRTSGSRAGRLNSEMLLDIALSGGGGASIQDIFFSQEGTAQDRVHRVVNRYADQRPTPFQMGLLANSNPEMAQMVQDLMQFRLTPGNENATYQHMIDPGRLGIAYKTFSSDDYNTYRDQQFAYRAMGQTIDIEKVRLANTLWARFGNDILKLTQSLVSWLADLPANVSLIDVIRNGLADLIEMAAPAFTVIRKGFGEFLIDVVNGIEKLAPTLIPTFIDVFKTISDTGIDFAFDLGRTLWGTFREVLAKFSEISISPKGLKDFFTGKGTLSDIFVKRSVTETPDAKDWHGDYKGKVESSQDIYQDTLTGKWMIGGRIGGLRSYELPTHVAEVAALSHPKAKTWAFNALVGGMNPMAMWAQIEEELEREGKTTEMGPVSSIVASKLNKYDVIGREILSTERQAQVKKQANSLYSTAGEIAMTHMGVAAEGARTTISKIIIETPSADELVLSLAELARGTKKHVNADPRGAEGITREATINVRNLLMGLGSSAVGGQGQ